MSATSPQVRQLLETGEHRVGDARRPRRHRKEPPRHRGRARDRGPLSRRHLLRPAGRRARSGLLLPTIAYFLGIRDNGEAGLEERIAHALDGPARADRARQLRADRGRRARPGAAVHGRADGDVPRDEPDRAAHPRRAGLRGRGAARAGRHRPGRAWSALAIAGRSALRRPRPGREARIRPHRRERRGRRRHLPAPRRTPAGDRARRGEGAPAHPAGHRPASRAQPPAADGLRARSARAAPHDARDDRLERRASCRTRSATCSKTSACSRRGSRSRPSSRSAADGRGTGRAWTRLAALVDASLVKQAEIGGRSDLLAAGDRARVRDRAAQGARRGGCHAHRACRLLHRLRPPDRARPARSRTGRRGRGSSASSCRTSARRRATSCTRIASTTPATSRGASSSTGGSPASSARCGCGCSSCSTSSSRSRSTPAPPPGSSRCGARCGGDPSDAGRQRARRVACGCSPRAATRMPRPWPSPPARRRGCSSPTSTRTRPRPELNEAVGELRALGNGWGEAMAEVGLGFLAVVRGQIEEAAGALLAVGGGRRRRAEHVHRGRRRQQPHARALLLGQVDAGRAGVVRSTLGLSARLHYDEGARTPSRACARSRPSRGDGWRAGALAAAAATIRQRIGSSTSRASRCTSQPLDGPARTRPRGRRRGRARGCRDEHRRGDRARAARRRRRRRDRRSPNGDGRHDR